MTNNKLDEILSKAPKAEIKRLYQEYNEMINVIGCFGVSDLKFFDRLEMEAFRRGLIEA